MEKTSNYENRKKMNDLLKGETKPNSATNWQLTKNFFIRALSDGECVFFDKKVHNGRKTAKNVFVKRDLRRTNLLTTDVKVKRGNARIKIIR